MCFEICGVQHLAEKEISDSTCNWYEIIILCLELFILIIFILNNKLTFDASQYCIHTFIKITGKCKLIDSHLQQNV